MFMLYFDNEKKRVHALNASGRSPAGLTLDLARAAQARGEKGEWARSDALTITVPGAVRGWEDALKRFGSLPMVELMLPAMGLAHDGFPVGPITAQLWHDGIEDLTKSCIRDGKKFEKLQILNELCLKERAPRAKEVFKNPGMTRALRKIAEATFYDEEMASWISQTCMDHGGVLTSKDIMEHRSTWIEPISVEYRGLRMWEVPPNSQGIVALFALQILKHLPDELRKIIELPTSHKTSVDYFHILIEVVRFAFGDVSRYVYDYGDDQENTKKFDSLLSGELPQKRAHQIDLAKTKANGEPWASSDTVSFQVVDSKGNAVSFVNSNFMSFGTGIVVPGYGFPLQNRGANFSTDDERHPNCAGPRKRPYHTLCPAMLTDAETDELVASLSNMGGFMQPQGHVQLILRLLQGMSPQEAVDAPRFCVTATGSVWIEDADIAEQLKCRGHDTKVIKSNAERCIVGRAQIIQRVNGVLEGGSDHRSDGRVEVLRREDMQS